MRQVPIARLDIMTEVRAFNGETPMTEELPGLLIVLVVMIVAYSSIRIAQEDERFAVFILGRFAGFDGPGLILRPAGISRLHRLKIGDTGMLESVEFAVFGGCAVPVSNTGALDVGRPVRITGFNDDGPVLTAAAERPMALCPKCGHKF